MELVVVVVVEVVVVMGVVAEWNKVDLYFCCRRLLLLLVGRRSFRPSLANSILFPLTSKLFN